MTDAKFRAPDDSGGTDALGAGMQRLGRAASSFAEAWSERDAMRDEAKTRKADNALVESWQTLSDPYFGASGEAVVKAGPATRQSLDEEIGRQRGTLDNDRQRGMFDQVAKLRRDEWLSRIGQHEDGAIRDFDETESQRRQGLAIGAMAAAAAKDYGPGVVANEQVLLGEVDGRSRRRGLDEAGAHQARVQALAAARAQAVEQLADVDPGKAQVWLDAHRADIGDPATLDRLDRMLQPFVEEQQADRIAGEIRAGTSGLDAQIAGVDGRDLSPDLAAAVKETLQRRARADDAATADAQKQATDKAWSIALDPAVTSLRTIPPTLYAALAPGEQDAIQQAIGANARMGDPAPDPALYLALSNKAAHGVLTIDDVRHAWGRLPQEQWRLVAHWQRDAPQQIPFSADDRLSNQTDSLSPIGSTYAPTDNSSHAGQDRYLNDGVYRPDIAAPARFTVSMVQHGDSFLPPVNGYPEDGLFGWRSENDVIFRKAADKFNADHGFKLGDPFFMDPYFLKAWAMVESGGSGDKSEFLRDPFQVNKRGDWVGEKVDIAGLEGPDQVMNPKISADAALKWFYNKSLIRDKNHRVIGQRDMKETLRRYNGSKHKDRYADKISALNALSIYKIMNDLSN